MVGHMTNAHKSVSVQNHSAGQLLPVCVHAHAHSGLSTTPDRQWKRLEVIDEWVRV